MEQPTFRRIKRDVNGNGLPVLLPFLSSSFSSSFFFISQGGREPTETSALSGKTRPVITL